MALLLSVLLAVVVAAEARSPSAVVVAWTQCYGHDTAKAAQLTTTRFRGGESLQDWTERTHRTLQRVGYHHLGGVVVKETIREKTAMVMLKAKIQTRLGVVEQTELYVLSREGEQWLLDDVDILDEEDLEMEGIVHSAENDLTTG